MEKLSHDELILIALEMKLKEILYLCMSYRKFYDKICDNQHFWIQKLKRDFNISYVGDINLAKENYKNIIDKLKKAKNEYHSLTTIAERFQSLHRNQHLILPDGNILDRNIVLALFNRWKEEYDILKILGETKTLELENNIRNLMNNRKYINNYKKFFKF